MELWGFWKCDSNETCRYLNDEAMVLISWSYEDYIVIFACLKRKGKICPVLGTRFKGLFW